MSHVVPRSRCARAVAATALALVLAGCGGDGEPTDEPAPSSAPSTSSTSSTAGADPSSSPGGGNGGNNGNGGNSGQQNGGNGGGPTGTPSSSSGGSGGGGGGSAFTYDEAKAEIDAAGTPRDVDGFTTDDDIYCLLDGRFVPPSCELPAQAGISDPQVCAKAPTDKVGRIALAKQGAAPQCNTDTIRGEPGATAGDGDVLSSTRQPVLCLVQGDGVLCVDTETRSGFRLAPGSYELTDG